MFLLVHTPVAFPLLWKVSDLWGCSLHVSQLRRIVGLKHRDAFAQQCDVLLKPLCFGVSAKQQPPVHEENLQLIDAMGGMMVLLARKTDEAAVAAHVLQTDVQFGKLAFLAFRNQPLEHRRQFLEVAVAHEVAVTTLEEGLRDGFMPLLRPVVHINSIL